MTDATRTTPDAEQTDNQPLTARVKAAADWNDLAKIALASLIGLGANAAVITAAIGSGFGAIADGLLLLCPAVVVGAALFHTYDPVELPYISPALLFVTLLLANSVTLTVRVFNNMGGVSEPMMTALIVGLVAAMFTPGAFLGAWAARRWWL